MAIQFDRAIDEQTDTTKVVTNIPIDLCDSDKWNTFVPYAMSVENEWKAYLMGPQNRFLLRFIL